MKRRSALLALGFSLAWGARGHAMNKCDGPAECCPPTIANRLDKQTKISVGVVLVGLNNVNERSGTWDADYYLYEAWPPTPGFTPQTEIVNEVLRPDGEPSFDNTELRNGRCVRARRVRSTLSSSFNLRLFPFDRQQLGIRLSDGEFDEHSVVYDDRPYVSGIEELARTQLSSWKNEGDLSFAHATRAFQWEEAAPKYDYATFSFPVRRHVTFHVAKFFLPLIVIILVCMMVLWIDPEDLNTRVTIGVTGLLAAIAFQYAEASNLPEVAYLTLADQIYTSSYVAIAFTMAQSVYARICIQRGNKEHAVRLDRVGRWALPGMLVCAFLLSVLISARGGSN